MKRVVIAGGSGFLGKLLSQYFSDQDYEVVILSRKHQIDQGNIHYQKWDARSLGSWTHVLEGSEAVINLTGKSVDCRYTDANMQQIYDSRLDATNVLGVAIAQCKEPPKVWLNASSATIYRYAEDREMDEYTGEIGEGFSVDVCQKWEQVFSRSETPKTRKVALRIAIVIGKSGGALQPLINLVKMRVGGAQGNGRQFFSWIHEEDFVRAVKYLMNNSEASGVYNLAAPNPVRNRRFMKTLRRVMKVSFGFSLPKLLLEIGAIFIRTETELILKSRRVVPARLMKDGFEFRYHLLEQALESIINFNKEQI